MYKREIIEKVVKQFPILTKETMVSTKYEKEFEDELEVEEIRFTLPKFLEGYDWLPSYKRDISDTSIKDALMQDKRLLHWTLYDETLIISFYNEEENLYYVMLYNYYNDCFNIGTVMIGKMEKEGETV